LGRVLTQTLVRNIQIPYDCQLIQNHGLCAFAAIFSTAAVRDGELLVRPLRRRRPERRGAEIASANKQGGRRREPGIVLRLRF
jgi:hypothetical protein